MSEAKKTMKAKPYSDALSYFRARTKMTTGLYGADHPETKSYGAGQAAVKALQKHQPDEALSHVAEMRGHIGKMPNGSGPDMRPIDKLGHAANVLSHQKHAREIEVAAHHQKGFTNPRDGYEFHLNHSGGDYYDEKTPHQKVHHALANGYAGMMQAGELGQPHRFKSAGEDLDHAEGHAASASDGMKKDVAHAKAMHATLSAAAAGGTVAKADGGENRFMALAQQVKQRFS